MVDGSDQKPDYRNSFARSVLRTASNLCTLGPCQMNSPIRGGHIPLSYSNPTCYALPMHLEATRNTRSNSHNFNPPYFFHRSLRNIFDAGFLFFFFFFLHTLAGEQSHSFHSSLKAYFNIFHAVFFNSTLTRNSTMESNLFAFVPNLIKPCTVAKLFA